MSFDRAFPPLLAALHQLPYEYDDGDGIDFEPYDEFQDAAENADWIRAWTGNDKLTASEYRIFGQDGTGGLAAFWLIREGADLLDQPIVFFGSEGELGVVAGNFADYLWLLAGGAGPYEAISYGPSDKGNEAFAAFAAEHAAAAKKSGAEVLARANKEFSTFEDDVRALCR